jgi:hypothetical protein
MKISSDMADGSARLLMDPAGRAIDHTIGPNSEAIGASLTDKHRFYS